jgi:hypothetical protein
MDMLLLVITIGSLIFALAMSVLAWRMSQDERRRTAARIAQLAAEASVPPLPATGAVAVPRAKLWASPPKAAAAESRVRFSETPADAATSPAVASRGAPNERMEPATHDLSLSSSFLTTPSHTPESAGRQRGLAMAAAVLALSFAVFGLVRILAPGAPSGNAGGAAASSTPLELLSLRHDRVGSRLSVSGLVKNPMGGQAVERLYAVVFVFDQAGTFVTSGRAPVDFIRIAAGDESPFVVALDAPQNVARYRVSFRTDDGTVPHVDKRGSPVATPADQQATVAVR